MTVRDFTEGINLKDATNATYTTQQKQQVDWARTSSSGYEVSTKGNKRFSAPVATFKPGTIIDGVDVGGKTIEHVYQNVIKKSGKGKAPAKNSKLYKCNGKCQTSDPFGLGSGTCFWTNRAQQWVLAVTAALCVWFYFFK